jgi:Ca2+-binding EF-hand superfamily protein
MFDRNNDQKISEKELYEVMKYLGVQATEKDVKAMIQVVDKNSNTNPFMIHLTKFKLNK